MRISNKGMYDIADHEGVVPYPYLDPVGIWTVGVGHTASAGPPDPAKMARGVEIPLAEVFRIFRRDLRKFEARVNAAVKVPMTQYEFDALVSFDFNTGGIHRAAITTRLNAGDRDGAAAAFMGWSKPASIIPRRKKEQELFRTGRYSNNGYVPVYTADAKGKVDLRSARLVSVATTTAPRPKPAPAPAPPPEYSLALVRDVQTRLLKHGYTQVGGIDGLMGDKTRSAIRDFRAKNGLPAVLTGDYIDDALIAALKRPDAVRPVIAPDRANATLPELQKQGSVIADGAEKSKKGAIATVVAGVGAVGSQIVESAGGLMSLGPALDPLRWLFEEYGVFLFGTVIVAMGGFIWWQSRRTGEARLQDHRSGNTSIVNLPSQVER